MDKKMLTRLRPLFIWQILVDETDASHQLSTKLIIEKLKEKGVECERRALQSDIQALMECGYPIKRTVSKDYSYYVEKREFSNGEIAMLMDAVQSVTFLTEDDTWVLIEKLLTLASGGQAKKELLLDNILLNHVHKTTNSEVMNTVYVIEKAMIEKKKISFNYFNLSSDFKPVYKMAGGEKKKYIVSPITKVIHNGNYYMLAITENHDNISIYRLDRMSDTTLLDSQRQIYIDPEKIEIFKKQLFEMYNGNEIIKVKIKIEDSLINKVYDIFGSEQIKLVKMDEHHYAFECEVMNSPMFRAWCCTYGEKLTVLSPQNFVKELSDYTKRLYEVYNVNEKNLKYMNLKLVFNRR